MRCDRYREAASARLDGEPVGVPTASLDQHHDSCPDCARWLAEATRLTRQARLSAVDVPDLTDTIMSDVVLPTRRVLRRRLALRVTLGLVALAQLTIAVPALAGVGVGMAMSEHIAHESAAWDVAVGIAFLAAAVAPRRASGLVPLLGTFVLVLAVLSIHDIIDREVTAVRELTHLAVVLGLALLVLLDRAERALPPRRARPLPSSEDERGRLRGVA
ncbi:MAG TPA: zf-HC2 domain-containing protein [Jatrophihabitantaceae bacterium]